MNTQIVTQIQFELKINNKPNFENILSEAINQVFSSILKENSEAFYNHLESTFKITRKEIPQKLTEFNDAIEQIFGDTAGLIQIKIMRALHEQAQDHAYLLENNNLVFSDYLVDLQRFLAIK
jgi:Zn-dependent oligopeptidase